MKLDTHLSLGHIKALLIFAAEDDIRFYLNGVCFEHGPTGARAYATDGHRMLVVKLDKDSAKAEKPTQYIIPRASLEAAVKLWKNTKVDMPIVFADNVLTLGGEVSAKPIDGKFPEIERVVPVKCSGKRAFYNHEYLYDCDRAKRLISGFKSYNMTAIAHNGDAAGVVRITEDAFAVVMPVRNDTLQDTPPEWFRAAKVKKPAKDKADKKPKVAPAHTNGSAGPVQVSAS